LLSFTLLGVPTWFEQGPETITNYAGVNSTINSKQVPATSVGAIESAAVEPRPGGYIVYAGTVNGGIWRSDNISDGMFNGSVSPTFATWRPLTDNQPSLATGSMALDLHDPSGNTLWVGTGSLSSTGTIGQPGTGLLSFGASGGPGVGLLKTTDGGSTWTVLGQFWLNGQRIVRVLPTMQTDTYSGQGHGGQIVLVASYDGGIYYSGDGGQHFIYELSGTGTDIVQNPNAPNIFYAALAGAGGGVWENTNFGYDPSKPNFGWSVLIGPHDSSNMKLAVTTDHATGHTILWAATTESVFRADASGTINFTLVGPSPFHPGGYAAGIPQSLSIAADPQSPNIVYVATFGGLLARITYAPGAPGTTNNGYAALLNSAGLFDTGNIFGDNTTYNGENASGKNAATLTYAHGDFRSLTFLNPTMLLATDDGGMYGVVVDGDNNQPLATDSHGVVQLNSPGWVSLVGSGLSQNFGIRDTEFYSVAYDTRNGIIFGGNQDNGSALQGAGPSLTWASYMGGDGGTSAVDPTTFNHQTEAFDPTLYGFWDGTFERTYEDDPYFKNYPPQIDGNVPLASINTPTTNYSGLNNVDRATILGFQPTGTDNYFPFALNSLGSFSDVSLTDPEPLLYGMTGIYESFDRGSTVLDVSPPGMSGNVKAIAYGSENNVYAAYFSTDSGQIWMRNGFGQIFASVPQLPGGAYAVKIATDPLDYHNVYALDNRGNVWYLPVNDHGKQTTNGGTVSGTWQSITSNLDRLASITGPLNLQGLDVFHPSGGNPVVLVSGFGGVYRGLLLAPTTNGSGGFIWSPYGAYFPNVLTPDVHYVPVYSDTFAYGNGGDVVLAGTLGRSAWLIPQASNLLEQPPDLIINADPVGTNNIRLVLDPAPSLRPILDVFQNNNTSTPNFRIAVSALSTIQVNSNGMPTNLTIDESNGLVLPNDQIQFNGGSGQDALFIDDGKDQASRSVTLGTDQVTGLGPTPINYSNVDLLTFQGNNASNDFFRLNNTDIATTETDLTTGTGGSLVSVLQTAAFTQTVISCTAVDNVTVGDNSVKGMQGIQGALTVNGVFDKPTLRLADQGDGSSLTFTVTDKSITNLAPATINYSSIGTLIISTGNGNDEAKVLNTAAPIILFGHVLATTTTEIQDGGTGNLVGIVTGTQSPLQISGAFLVQVGTGAVGAIHGDVQVEGPNVVTLEVNDASDTHAEQPQLGKASDFATSGNYALTGLVPATIAFGKNVGLAVQDFGPGGTFTVNDTLANTNTSVEGTGTVDVLGTTGDLSVTGPTLVDVGLGNAQKVNGQVFVSEPFGDIFDHAKLIVDDSSDTASKTVTTGLAFGTVYSITGLAPATIEYQGPQVSSVTIDAPNVFGNSITVNGTPAGTALTVHAGFDGDITVIEVPGIGGPLTVAPGVDNTTYLFDGPATDNTRTYTITNTSVTRTGGFAMNLIYPTGFPISESFALYTGNSFTDTINLQSSLAGTGWFLDAAPFNPNVFNLGDPVQGLATIQGEVHVNDEAEPGSTDNETVNLNDQPDKAAQTITFGFDTATALNKVSWNGGGFLLYDNTFPFLDKLNVNAGSGNTTFKVQTLPNTTSITLKGGSGSNTLDYSPFVGNITVDLPDGQATGFSGGFSNIQTVIGSQGNDTFFVPSAASGTAATITGGTGKNTYFVGTNGKKAGQVKNISGAVVLTGAGPSNTLTLDDSGNTTTTDTVSLTPTAVNGSSFFGAGGSLTYTGIGSVILNSSNASIMSGSKVTGDTITVTPKSGMLFTINGDNPPAGSHPGDSLTVSTVNGAVTDHPSTTAGSGDFTFSGKTTPIVNYTGIETIVPVGWLVAAPDAGHRHEVKVYNAQSGVLRFDIRPFASSFRGGVRVAVGDLNGDGIPDIIAAQGPGDADDGDSRVHVYDGITGQLLAGPLGNFDPFPGFHGGLYVASADLNGDGYAEILVSQDVGGQGWVKVFSGKTGALLAQFQPYGPYLGGVRLAAGPVTSNGHVDVVTGAGPGGPPLVEIVDGPNLVQGVSTPEATFDAFDPSFTGGVYVATGLIHDQGHPPAAIIVGEGIGGHPRVSIFDGTGTLVQTFLAFDPGFKGGVRVAAADVNGDGRSDIIAAEGPGAGSRPLVRGFDGVSLQPIESFLAFPKHVRDGLFVAGGGRWGLFQPASNTVSPPSSEHSSATAAGGLSAGGTRSGSLGAALPTFNGVADSIAFPPERVSEPANSPSNLPLDMASEMSNFSVSPPPRAVDAVFAGGLEPSLVRAADFLFAAMGAQLKHENHTVLAS
jgi:hypothetical protein